MDLSLREVEDKGITDITGLAWAECQRGGLGEMGLCEDLEPSLQPDGGGRGDEGLKWQD